MKGESPTVIPETMSDRGEPLGPDRRSDTLETKERKRGNQAEGSDIPSLSGASTRCDFGRPVVRLGTWFRNQDQINPKGSFRFGVGLSRRIIPE